MIFAGEDWCLLVQIRYLYHIQKVKKPPNWLSFHQNRTSKVKYRVIWFLEVRRWRFKKHNYSSDFQTTISPSYGLLFSSNFFYFGVEFHDLHIGVCCLRSLFLNYSTNHKSWFLPLQILSMGSSGHIIRFHFFWKCIIFCLLSRSSIIL